MGLVFPGAKFTMKKPRAMAARMLSNPSWLQIPVERKSPPRPKESTRPASCIRFLITKATRAPKNPPTIMEPKISFAMFRSCAPRETEFPPRRGATRVEAIA